MKLEVLDDKDAVAARAAEILGAARGHIALSGGSTPKAAYGLVAGRDWSDTTLWLGDERHVPADDERSNYRMAREQLGPDAPIEAVDTALDLDAAAADYARRLEGVRLDLALMGLGPDGHTASLFPGKPALEATGTPAIGVPEAGMDPRVPRITLTLEVFNAAAEVVFLVAGEDKAQALARAFGDPPDVTAPSARVRPTAGRLVVVADRAAAADLP
jgi:6-phosphogluconolactonase